MKGLIVILGESFRSGGQGSRTRGLPESIEDQMNAANSHIKFIEHIKEKYNCDSDILLCTYSTQYDNKLTDVYSKYLVESKFHTELKGLTGLFHDGIVSMGGNIINYDFVLYFRVDMFLKDKFLEIFDPSWKTIHFICICWSFWNFCLGNPRVNDTMLFLPQKYFNCLLKISVWHDSWTMFLRKCNLTNDDLDVMVNTYHDSDSEKDFNPYYRFVNRPEHTKWHSEGEIFVKPEKGVVENFMNFIKTRKQYKGLNSSLIIKLLIVFVLILMLN